jgi:hypothetical protein
MGKRTPFVLLHCHTFALFRNRVFILPHSGQWGLCGIAFNPLLRLKPAAANPGVSIGPRIFWGRVFMLSVFQRSRRSSFLFSFAYYASAFRAGPEIAFKCVGRDNHDFSVLSAGANRASHIFPEFYALSLALFASIGPSINRKRSKCRCSSAR